MSRYALALFLCVAAPLYADEVIWYGDPYAFASPPYPYDPETGYELTIGYGNDFDTIGDWYTQPGVYDLSSDPDLGGFLATATNGMSDTLTIRVADAAGHEVIVNSLTENDVFQRATDLWPLPVTGVLLNLFYIDEPGVSVRWDFMGIPEPTSLMLVLLGTGLVGRRGCKMDGPDCL